MKSWIFNGLLTGSVVLALYLPVRDLPDRRPLPAATEMVRYQTVKLSPSTGPLRLAGAWQVEVPDRRFGGLSALAIDQGRFLAVSDLGAVVRFDPPSVRSPRASIADLGDGPGDPGYKTSRDAESLVRDPQESGWWVGYEQGHSLWRYDDDFGLAAQSVDLDRPDWWRNRGAEGLLTDGAALLVIAENGREVMRIRGQGIERLPLDTGMDVADAARAPDGSGWLLLRTKGLGGIAQAIAPLVRTATGYRVGAKWAVPKARLDNYEGMAIAARPDGGWRYWLVSDDGHRIGGRTLVVALDLDPPPHKSKRPTSNAGRRNHRDSDAFRRLP
ncbi:MAG: esterase-like activity of phytase family protein [Sphingomicrobium sp.]